MQVLDVDEPSWFHVVGGPPPGEVVVREVLLAMLVVVLGLAVGLWLPDPWRLLLSMGSALSAVPMFFLLQRQWRANQQVRVLGNLLEHRDGDRVVRVALNRAVVSTAVAPPALLVLMLDDGRSSVTVARRADLHELADLPPCGGSYLELEPDDFEAIRQAAQRTYPLA
jgi:hypothetical protein